MRKTFLLLTLTVVFCLPLFSQKTISNTHLLHDGDLLFVVATETNAITEVTNHSDTPSVDHVGIFHRHSGQAMVLEATYEGVKETTIEQFLENTSHVLVGRIRGSFDVSGSLAKAHQYLGSPYDFIYFPDDDAIYCSELVMLSYQNKKGVPIFTPIPMSFHDNSGHITPYWEDFYSRRNLDVPEGQPGSNPNELSRRKCVKLKYQLRGIVK